MTEWINLILTALASMGVGGIGAIWYSKRKAKADVSNVEAQTGQVEAQTDQVQMEVLKSVQDVYDRTIERLKLDRDDVNEELSAAKQEIASLKQEMATLKQEMNAQKQASIAQQQEIESNKEKLAATEDMLKVISPLTCCIRNCTDRVEFAPGMDLTKMARKRKQIKNEVHSKRNTDKEDQGV